MAQSPSANTFSETLSQSSIYHAHPRPPFLPYLDATSHGLEPGVPDKVHALESGGPDHHAYPPHTHAVSARMRTGHSPVGILVPSDKRVSCVSVSISVTATSSRTSMSLDLKRFSTYSPGKA